MRRRGTKIECAATVSNLVFNKGLSPLIAALSAPPTTNSAFVKTKKKEI